MNILIEGMSASDGNIVTQAPKDSKDVFLSGVFMQAEVKNRNGRIYSLQEMTNAISNMNESIKAYGGVFGELDHPQSLTINMDRISHVITELRMHGNNVIGKAKLLDTPMGLIAKELSRSGVRYGVSSRGIGNVNESGLVSGFVLHTIDLVATPSAQGAYPDVMAESVIQNYKEGALITLAESMKQDKNAQKYFKSAVMDYIKEILK